MSSSLIKKLGFLLFGKLHVSVPQITHTTVSKPSGVHFLILLSSVGDPDPHVFGRPASGSVSVRYRSGSFHFFINVLSGLK
jgi:hypothetical protein